MKNLVKVEKPSTLPTNFKGIEILEAKSGSGGTDFKGIRLRDSITKEELLIELGPYSDLNIFVERQKAFTKKIRATCPLPQGGDAVREFDKREDVDDWAKSIGAEGFVCEEIQVEVKE